MVQGRSMFEMSYRDRMHASVIQRRRGGQGRGQDRNSTGRTGMRSGSTSDKADRYTVKIKFDKAVGDAFRMEYQQGGQGCRVVGANDRGAILKLS